MWPFSVGFLGFMKSSCTLFYRPSGALLEKSSRLHCRFWCAKVCHKILRDYLRFEWELAIPSIIQLKLLDTFLWKYPWARGIWFYDRTPNGHAQNRSSKLRSDQLVRCKVHALKFSDFFVSSFANADSILDIIARIVCGSQEILLAAAARERSPDPYVATCAQAQIIACVPRGYAPIECYSALSVDSKTRAYMRGRSPIS